MTSIGVESMRQSVQGGPLPSARAVSLGIFPDLDVPHRFHTLIAVEFGQFIDHDITHTAITKMESEEGEHHSKDYKFKGGFASQNLRHLSELRTAF